MEETREDMRACPYEVLLLPRLGLSPKPLLTCSFCPLLCDPHVLTFPLRLTPLSLDFSHIPPQKCSSHLGSPRVLPVTTAGWTRAWGRGERALGADLL